MKAPLGVYGGWIRNLRGPAWLWYQALLTLVSSILVSVAAAIGGLGWLFATVIAIAFAALVAISSQARVAAFPSHPQALLRLLHAAAAAQSFDDFRQVLANDWSVDQTGKPSQVHVEITAGAPVSAIAFTGETMVLPFDESAVVTVKSDATIFDPADHSFWVEVWSAWQPAITRAKREKPSV